MCGICGIVDCAGHDRADRALVQGMSERIRHRGPDGDGFYTAPNVALGMRRLSIIDVDGSNQPLYSEDRSIAMVFNGEIYNYRELRDQIGKRGHTFSTEGDGETLIHLYEDYGLALFDHLRGMYAFALWDTNTQRLILAVDHIGMKPLYLYECNGLLMFASEIKAFFADPSVPRTLNLQTLDTYLSFGYMIGQETLFEGIRRLPPGHALVVENGATRLHRFWQFDTPTAHGEPSAEETIAEARQRIAESVHIHLRSDVPLGLFLSGGIDSAAMLALMAQEAAGRIKTFTVGYQTATPDNELLRARETAQRFQTDHVECVISADDWWNGFQDYVYTHDEPNANPSMVSLLLLSRETAKQVKVVLTGLGGDELFGGYASHRVIPRVLQQHDQWGQQLSAFNGTLGALERWYPTMKRARIIGAIPTYLPAIRHATFPTDEGLRRVQSFDGMVFSDSLRQRLYSPALMQTWQETHHKEQTYRAIVAQSWRDDPYNTAQALVINTWLTGNALLAQDKVAMAASLEARVPFFDPALLTFAANVPPQTRMRSNKYVLREAMRPYLGEDVLNRSKQPFGTPIANWFDHELSDRVQAVIRDKSAFSRQWFNFPAVEKLLDDHRAKRARHEEVIFRLATLELWAQRFLQGASVRAS